VTTPKLQMPELSVGQAGKELTHNQALAILDQLAQAVVVDKDLATPPGSPANGAMYIVATGATGAWAGRSGNLAFWLTSVGAWTFAVPVNGWSVWVTDESARYERKSGTWSVASTITTDTGVIGYALGSGGEVTQLTSKTTGVTLNKPSGQITMAGNEMTSGEVASFTLTNSRIAINMTPVVTIKSGATAGAYILQVDAAGSGSCVISVRNMSGGPLSEAIVLQFNLIGGAIA